MTHSVGFVNVGFANVYAMGLNIQYLNLVIP